MSQPKGQEGNKVVIIGAGVGGLQTLRSLLRHGFHSATILEQGSTLGAGGSYRGLALQGAGGGQEAGATHYMPCNTFKLKHHLHAACYFETAS